MERHQALILFRTLVGRVGLGIETEAEQFPTWGHHEPQ